jgi:hypothetical protein
MITIPKSTFYAMNDKKKSAKNPLENIKRQYKRMRSPSLSTASERDDETCSTKGHSSIGSQATASKLPQSLEELLSTLRDVLKVGIKYIFLRYA